KSPGGSTAHAFAIDAISVGTPISKVVIYIDGACARRSRLAPQPTSRTSCLKGGRQQCLTTIEFKMVQEIYQQHCRADLHLSGRIVLSSRKFRGSKAPIERSRRLIHSSPSWRAQVKR